MSAPGKKLEALVASIESILLPQGFKVEKNILVRNEKGSIAAEMDVLISGQLGSGPVRWLIECRDRPSEGAQSVSWIEQLVGRRRHLALSKISAVSTTGFSKGAIDLAEREGIELKTYFEISAAEIRNWFACTSLVVQTRHVHSTNVTLLVPPGTPIEAIDALSRRISPAGNNDRFLRSTKNNQLFDIAAAVGGAMSSNLEKFPDVVPNAPAKKLRCRFIFDDENDRYVVDTNKGTIPIAAIVASVSVSISQREIPISRVSEYRNLSSVEPISQSVEFSLSSLNSSPSLTLHRVAAGEEAVIGVSITTKATSSSE